MAKSTVEMTPEERKLHGIRCMIGRANGYLKMAKTPTEVAKRTEELKEAIAKYEEATGLPYTGPGIKNRNTFKEDEIVIYKNGSSFEIGRIKSLADDGAFVFYSMGETAAKTPYDKLYKVTNASCVGQTRLGWYADHGEQCTLFQHPIDYADVYVRRMIDVAPTIDAVPVVRGEWIKKSNEEAETLALCSKCSYPISWWHKTNYCPNCGAKMEVQP